MRQSLRIAASCRLASARPVSCRSFGWQNGGNCAECAQLRGLGMPSRIAENTRKQAISGGGGGIRTPETPEGLTVFKTVAINHSATPPRATCPQDTGFPSSVPVSRMPGLDCAREIRDPDTLRYSRGRKGEARWAFTCETRCPCQDGYSAFRSQVWSCGIATNPHEIDRPACDDP